MSYTAVQNRFWSDGWIRQLNALDRYLFLYLLTNGRARLTGIYELPLDLMASESGIDEKDLRLSMLQRLEPKVYYKEGWVIFMNFIKHRVSNSPALIEGINKEFGTLPNHIKEIAIQKGYPLHTLPIGSRNRIEEKRIDITAEAGISPFKVVPDKETEREKPDKKITQAYEAMIRWAEAERGFPFLKTERLKQYKALKIARDNNLKSLQLKERWEEMSADKFWSTTGFDWMNVVLSFNKKQ